MTPAPGTRRVRWVGDGITFQLSGVPEGWTVRLRTQLGRAAAQRAEILAASRERRDEGLAGWQDLPMSRVAEGVWEVLVPLSEVGFFPAKAYAIDERGWQHWPGGPDFGVNVLPAWTRSGNSLYCVFPRQFGPNRDRRSTEDPAREAQLDALAAEGYAPLPPSGKLRDVTRSLDHICGTLGFRDLLLLPVNPTPTTFARFGRFGSPYAAQDLTAIDPALVEFDQRTTGVQQFEELAHAVHCRGGRVFLDMVINHTGWGSTLWERHPEWFHRTPDGRFLSPGAWGTVWEDLVELDPQSRDLWHELAQAFVTWCRRGVDGFRCDAGYKVPVPVWRYITALVRQEFPDTVFLLEGLGGSWEATEALLTVGGMQWAYSELFQNYDPGSIRWYLDAALEISERSGPLVHFSETHDNVRLPSQPQAGDGIPGGARSRVPERARRWSRLRNALCALTSVAGGYAITNGVEWLATERVNVHRDRGLAWGSEDHLIPEIAALNRLLRQHPAFRGDARLSRLSGESSPVYALCRRPADGSAPVLVLVNTDLDASQAVDLPGALWRDLGEPTLELLAMGGMPEPVGVSWREADTVRLELPAAGAACLSSQPVPAEEPASARFEEPRWASTSYRAEIEWAVADASRVVVWPIDHVLVLRDARRFRARLAGERAVRHLESRPVRTPDGIRHEVRLVDPSIESGRVHLTLTPLVPGNPAVEGHLQRTSGLPLPLPPGWTHERGPVLLTNGRGAMSRIHPDTHHVASKYDAFLAVNLDREVPCDRHVLVKRLRAWVSADGFESALRHPLWVESDDAGGQWRWRVPAGGARSVRIGMQAGFVPGRNTLVLRFWREAAGDGGGGLPASAPVRLALRMDLEDRGYHHETQRNQGSERHFTGSTTTGPDGFRFQPASDRDLRVTAQPGAFHAAEEWSTGIPHPLEASRGMVAHGDAWSPGWFEIPLAEGDAATVTLDAEPVRAGQGADGMSAGGEPYPAWVHADPRALALCRAARQFVVRRGAGKTVIAGYPWFLDWGRDTLIACRGLLAAGMTDTVRDIVLTFARFEDQGTLPNAIYGNNASNRDTTDAPLWFGVVCEELSASSAPGVVPSLPVGDAAGRTLGAVLRSIACGYLAGTPNGIRVDAASGLVWSPSHFTWMDTNHPAGTPREGYPVEIQVLWWRLLRQLEGLGAEPWEGRGERWGDLARRVERSFEQYFWLEHCGWLADVLLAARGVPARMAPPSDALRSNGLLAVALGMVTGERARRIVAAAQQWLVVPGALRSLAPLPVNPPLPVHGHGGGLLNDPAHPYWPRYEGDEDTRRKPAYHNGTAWVWPFPHFCEALVRAYPGDASAVRAARSYLQSVGGLMDAGCVGHLPEILDGDAPHAPRGCDAQAWSVTEVLRVWHWLQGLESPAERQG